MKLWYFCANIKMWGME